MNKNQMLVDMVIVRVFMSSLIARLKEVVCHMSNAKQPRIARTRTNGKTLGKSDAYKKTSGSSDGSPQDMTL